MEHLNDYRKILEGPTHGRGELYNFLVFIGVIFLHIKMQQKINKWDQQGEDVYLVRFITKG